MGPLADSMSFAPQTMEGPGPALSIAQFQAGKLLKEEDWQSKTWHGQCMM